MRKFAIAIILISVNYGEFNLNWIVYLNEGRSLRHLICSNVNLHMTTATQMLSIKI